MRYRYPLLVILSILVLVAGSYGSYRAFRPSGFPFTVKVVSAHVAVIEPIAGMPMPATLQAGDQIDLPAMDAASRIAITIAANSYGQLLPVGHTYQLVMQQPHASVTVPVVTVYTNNGTGSWISSLSLGVLMWLMSVVALMLLWRGRGRAAAGMTLWSIAWMTGIALEIAPLDGVEGLTVMVIAYFCILTSRIGFYVMFEAMLKGVFRSRVLLVWRLAFAVQWLVALWWILASNLVFPLGGSAKFLIPGWGSLLGVSYLVPLVMLYSGYHAVDAHARQRLRWMLWGGTLWVISAFGSDVITFASFSWNLVWTAGLMLGTCCFVYAVLRHRVVNVSVFIDRTLVYGGLTAIVVGILAAVNSLVQHAALGSSASLLLQIIVPLALGIVLGQARNYAGKFVERIFFRKRFLAEKALRGFARRSGGYEKANDLLAATVLEVHGQLNAPAVAVYVRNGEQYICANHAGESLYPREIHAADPTFAAARSGVKDVDLSELSSGLGTSGHAFPMRAPGGMQGVLVCANRPGEQYATDERKLLVHVARQLGLVLHTLILQEQIQRLEAQSKLVDALANSSWPPSAEIQIKARALAGAPISS